MKHSSLLAASASAAFVLAACGGGAPPKDTTTMPTPTASSAGSEPSATPAAASATPPSTAPESAAPASKVEPEPTSEAPTPARNLGERLFAPTIAYMLNYSASGAKTKVEQTCAAKTGDDPAAKAACIDKERGKLTADVLVFVHKDKATSLTIYKRTGNALTEVSSAQIDVSKDSPERIDIAVRSEKGSRQLFAGKKQFFVSSASDSSIAVDDPQFGQLVYEARIGLMNSD